MRPVSVKRPEGPRTASSTTATTIRMDDLVVALFSCALERAGEGRDCLAVPDNVDNVDWMLFPVRRQRQQRRWIVHRSCRGHRWGVFAPPGGVADQFNHTFQMGQPDNAQSCLSPGSRVNRGNAGGGGAGYKNHSMASLAACHVDRQNPCVNWGSAAERQR